MNLLVIVFSFLLCSMAVNAGYVAILGEDNVVENVIVTGNDNWDIETIPSSFVRVTDEMRCPSKGDIFSLEHNNFISPKPYPSWVLSEDLTWNAPVIRPVVDVRKTTIWNEQKLNWDILD